MILGFLTKYRNYRARVHTGTGGDTSSSYNMVKVFIKFDFVYDHFSGTHCVGPLVDKMDTNNMRFFNLSELSQPPVTSNITDFTTLAPVIQPWPIKIGDSIMYKCEPYTHRSVIVFSKSRLPGSFCTTFTIS